ncbi:MAG: hypothetical protein JWM23_1009 [Microbacteriaceae bacterium]|nr:hypothetical protein [Microbacteriaceae bacterium]
MNAIDVVAEPESWAPAAGALPTIDELLEESRQTAVVGLHRDGAGAPGHEPDPAGACPGHPRAAPVAARRLRSIRRGLAGTRRRGAVHRQSTPAATRSAWLRPNAGDALAGDAPRSPAVRYVYNTFVGRTKVLYTYLSAARLPRERAIDPGHQARAAAPSRYCAPRCSSGRRSPRPWSLLRSVPSTYSSG